MAELITNGGFEDALAIWQTTGTAGRQSSVVYEGSYAGFVRASRTPVFGGGWSDQTGILRQDLTTVAGVQYAFTSRVFIGPGFDANGVVEFDCGGGCVHQETFGAAQAGSWIESSTTTIAAGGAGFVRIRTTNPADNSNGNIYVDAVSVTGSDNMAVTKNIKNNMVTDLTGLTVRSGVTIQDVFLEPKNLHEIERFPAIFIVPGDGGTAELETISNRYGKARQVYILQYVDRTTTPNDDMDDATDAIRNALENSSTTLEAMQETIDIVVESWSPVIATDELTADTIYFRNHDLAVGYVYERGNA